LGPASLLRVRGARLSEACDIVYYNTQSHVKSFLRGRRADLCYGWIERGALPNVGSCGPTGLGPTR